MLIWLGLLLLPSLASADTNIFADFDGDGRRDQAVIDQRGSGIRVWLSRSGRTAVLPMSTPAAQLAAGDLDGDRRAELLVIGASMRLQVWTVRSSGQLSTFPERLPRLPRLAAGGASHAAPSDGPAVDATVPVPFALAPSIIRAFGQAPASPPLIPIATWPPGPRVTVTRSPRPPPVAL